MGNDNSKPDNRDTRGKSLHFGSHQKPQQYVNGQEYAAHSQNFENWQIPTPQSSNSRTVPQPAVRVNVQNNPGTSNQYANKVPPNLKAAQTINNPFANKEEPKFPQPTSYDSSKNPYVWQKSISDTTPLDFDKELPNIKNEIHDGDDSAKAFSKELNQSKTIAEARKSLINSKYLSDVIFMLDSKIIYAHKLFLITSSPLFYNHFETNGNKSMKIEDISEEYFDYMLAFCYTGQLKKVTEENVLSMLTVASKLKITQVCSICYAFISSKITPDGVFLVFDKAISANNDQFQKKCLDFIKKNEEKVFNSNGFFQIGLTVLLKILEKCEYPAEKRDGIIEKYHHGSMTKKLEVGKPKAKPQNIKKDQQPKPSKKAQKAKSNQNIPKLMELEIPPPPLSEGFHYPSSSNISDSINQLVIFGVDDDDDCNSDLVCVDDEDNGRIKIEVRGNETFGLTEFSRIDFVVKRSFLLHEIWFNDNMIENANEVRFSVSVFENDKRSDIHGRTVKKQQNINNLKFIKFSQRPLKLYVGQKFFIKMNFNKKATRKHLDPQNLSSTDIMELRRDDEVRKYFNCVNKLVVTEMT